jgi:hypothetical protein
MSKWGRGDCSVRIFCVGIHISSIVKIIKYILAVERAKIIYLLSLLSNIFMSF